MIGMFLNTQKSVNKFYGDTQECHPRLQKESRALLITLIFWLPKHLQVLNNSIVPTLQKIMFPKEFAQEVLANSQQTRLNI